MSTMTKATDDCHDDQHLRMMMPKKTSVTTTTMTTVMTTTITTTMTMMTTMTKMIRPL